MDDNMAEFDALLLKEFSTDLEGMSEKEVDNEIIRMEYELAEIENWLEALHAKKRSFHT